MNFDLSEEQQLLADSLTPLSFGFLTSCAVWLGVSRSTVRRMCRDGELPTVYVRGAARIPRSAVLAHVARQMTGGAA